MWLPSPSGFPTGVMTHLGIDVKVQIYFTFNTLLAVALSYVVLFENRYDVIVIGSQGRSKNRNTFRFLYFLVNVLYTEATVAYISWHFPSQEEGRINVLEKLPCIPLNLVQNPNFIHLNVHSFFVPIFTCTMIMAVVLQGFYFVFYTMCFLFLGAGIVSKNTKSMQKKFFIAMLLQAFIPMIAFFTPMFYCFVSWQLRYYNQVFNNFAMIAVGSNGLFTTIVMILVHNPYRKAVEEIFCVKKFGDVPATVISLLIRPVFSDRRNVVMN